MRRSKRARAERVSAGVRVPANLISTSRRTDIPHYFGAWFGERRTAGFAEFRGAFGSAGRVSLRDDDVLGYLFWTKYARPFADQLRRLRDDGIPYAFQYTINGYGRDIEPHIPRRNRVIEDLLAVAEQMPDRACIQWRYDPIVLSGAYGIDFHLENFAAIARSIEGATRVVNISIVEPYAKAVRRMADESVRYRRIDPKRHRWASRRHRQLAEAGADIVPFLNALAAIAHQHGMELRSCSNPEWPLPRAECCSPELFTAYGADVARAVASLPVAPTRDGCRCLKATDIGMDNSCLGGCRYCYVVTSHQTAVENFRRHESSKTALR